MPRQSIFGGAKLYADLLKKTGGDKVHADELYYAGSDRNIGKNTIQYGLNTDAARSAIGIGDTPIPGSTDAGAGTGRGTSTDLRVHITSDPITLQDPNGNVRGQAKLRPYADGPPAGLSFGGIY